MAGTQSGSPAHIRPATGKLGILIPGMGAVATTFMAGVESIRRGRSKPIGSLTQMGTIRLGKRTDESPLHPGVRAAGRPKRHRVRWLGLLPDDAYQAATKAGVLSSEHLAPLKDFLRRIKPMTSVFVQEYVKNLTATHAKTGKTKLDLAEQVIEDIKNFKKTNNCDRLVMVWCGSTEVYRTPAPVHATVASFEKGLVESDPEIAPSQIYAYAALKCGVPYANGAPNLTVDMPALLELAKQNGVPAGRQGLQDGSDAHEDDPRAGLQGALLGVDGWYSTNILGNRDGEVLDDPESFKTKEVSKLGVLDHPAAAPLSRPLRQHVPRGAASTTTRPAATTKRAGTTSTSSGGWATRCRSRSTSSAGTRSSRPPSVLDLALFMDLAQRCGMSGDPGVAAVLLEEPADAARPLPRARHLHPAHEAQEHAPPPARRRSHHPPRRRVLRLEVAEVVARAVAFGIELDRATELGERGAAGARVGGRLAEQRPPERRAKVGLIGQSAPPAGTPRPPRGAGSRAGAACRRRRGRARRRSRPARRQVGPAPRARRPSSSRAVSSIASARSLPDSSLATYARRRAGSPQHPVRLGQAIEDLLRQLAILLGRWR